MQTFMMFCAALALVITETGCSTTSQTRSKPVPVFYDGARILFQGDSITDGNRGRNADPNHILGHGYQALIASRFGADYPDKHLTFINRGISGNTVLDLSKRWQADTIDLKPDILSILIGVNDLNAGVSADEYRQRYDQLLSETVRALPNVRLILCEPFGLPVGQKKSNWDSFSRDLAMRDKIVNELAEKYHAPVVHLQQVFVQAAQKAPANYWIWDGIHPTYAGHQLIADEWVATVRGFWRD